MRASARESSSSNSRRAAVAGAALAAYALTFWARGWVRDDRWLIADNALFRPGLSAAGRVLTTGYVEAARGAAAPIAEYRPLLSLSFLAQLAASRRPWSFHAANAALHAAVCLLLLAALARRLPSDAAFAGALLFAVMPVHAEAVSYVTSRSELLAAASLLCCWLLLAPPRPRLAAGLACYAAGLLSKESALMIAPFLALSDLWLDETRPWEPGRRRVYAGLAAVTVFYLALRAAALGSAHGAGLPFFATRLDALWGWPPFVWERYVWPSVTGLGLCADFTVNGGPVHAAASLGAALSLGALMLAALASGFGAAARRRWVFWVAAPSLFLLPTCPLLVPLDTIGAERFLYIPTIGLAAALGAAFARARRARPRAAAAGLAALTLWYAAALERRNRVWLSELAYYEAAGACNPGSARARGGLGAALAAAGREQEGRRRLEEAAALDPKLAQPRFDLAVLAWRQGRRAEALARAREAAALDPGSADALVMLAVAQDAAGDGRGAQASLRRALALMPWNALAHFNLGRLLVLDGRAAEGAAHLREFARLAPDDPDARRWRP